MSKFIFLGLFITTFYLVKKKKNFKKTLIISLGVVLFLWFVYEMLIDNKNNDNIIYTISSDEYIQSKKLPNIFVEIEDFTI